MVFPQAVGVGVPTSIPVLARSSVFLSEEPEMLRLRCAALRSVTYRGRLYLPRR